MKNSCCKKCVAAHSLRLGLIIDFVDSSCVLTAQKSILKLISSRSSLLVRALCTVSHPFHGSQQDKLSNQAFETPLALKFYLQCVSRSLHFMHHRVRASFRITFSVLCLPSLSGRQRVRRRKGRGQKSPPPAAPLYITFTFSTFLFIFYAFIHIPKLPLFITRPHVSGRRRNEAPITTQHLPPWPHQTSHAPQFCTFAEHLSPRTFNISPFCHRRQKSLALH